MSIDRSLRAASERIVREVNRAGPAAFWLVVVGALVIYLVLRIGFIIVEQNITDVSPPL